MPSELDIYRSAALYIKQHGEDAPIFAAMQADKCLEAGDLDGKAVWMRVIRAIEELRPPPRRPVTQPHIPLTPASKQADSIYAYRNAWKLLTGNDWK